MRNSRSSLNLFRSIGKLFEQTGRALQDKEGYVESLVPSTRIVSFRGKEPTTGLQNFVASTASLIGDVKLAEHASTWYGATIKGKMINYFLPTWKPSCCLQATFLTNFL
jgi:hypothetical protein